LGKTKEAKMDIPSQLIEQLVRGNVLLFAGQEIYTAPDGRPETAVLAERLAARCRYPGSSPQFADVAQNYEHEFGHQALVEFVRENMASTLTESHRVAELLGRLNTVNVYVTTCFDSRLQKGLQAAGRYPAVVVGNEDVAFEHEGRPTVYMLFGSIDQPTSLLLTTEEISDFLDSRENLSDILRGELARRTVVFLGHQLPTGSFDQLYRKTVQQLDKFRRRAYAVVSSPSIEAQRWCERHKVELVQAEVKDFLEQLVAFLPTTAPGPRFEVPMPSPLPYAPYKGLNYYEVEDAPLFYGRTQEARHLAALVHAHRLVLLFGPSGAGKTSLINAGLTPVLESEPICYEVIYTRPIDEPTSTIVEALNRRCGQRISEPTVPLIDAVVSASARLGKPLILVMDQFEEFFVRHRVAVRRSLISQLGEIYDAIEVPVKVLITLREDWLARIQELEKRIPEVFQNRFRLLPLTRQAAMDAVVKPVAQLGISYSSDLTTRLLDELTVDGEIMPPQLQIVCQRLYYSLPEGESRITVDRYEGLGGVSQILRDYLRSEIERLPPLDQKVAWRVLEELVTSEGTKAVRLLDGLQQQIQGEATALDDLLRTLENARLVRRLSLAEGEAYELTHEYLVQEIQLEEAIVLRKQAEELLVRELQDWGRYDTWMSPEKYRIVEAQKDRLRLSPEAVEMMTLSALRYGGDLPYWRTRTEDPAKLVDRVLHKIDNLSPQEQQHVVRSLGDLLNAPMITILGHASAHGRRLGIQAVMRNSDVPGLEPLLVHMLGDENWIARQAAVRALAIQGGTRSREAIAGALSDTHQEVRLSACNELAHLGCREALVPLTDVLLHDKIETVRVASAQALGSLGSQDAVGSLVRILRSPKESARLRGAAARALGVLGGEVATRELAQVLNSRVWEHLGAIDRPWEDVPVLLETDEQARAKLAFEIGEAFVQAIENQGDQAVVVLKDELRTQSHVLEALVNVGPPAVPILVQTLRNTFGEAAMASAEALGRIGTRECIVPLLEALGSQDVRVRVIAFEHLKSFSYSLEQCYRDILSSHRGLQAQMALVLSESNAPGVLEALLRCSNSPHAEVRKATAWALGTLDSAEAIQALIRLLGDRDEGVREIAAVRLGMLGADAAVPSLVQALQDENEKVRCAVQWALRVMETRAKIGVEDNDEPETS
jgi:HEAT repeat protein